MKIVPRDVKTVIQTDANTKCLSNPLHSPPRFAIFLPIQLPEQQLQK